MLKIIFGDIENSVYHPPTYFDNQYEDEWVTDPLSVEMIRDIDKSKVISPIRTNFSANSLNSWYNQKG